jgi:hypothetical protein
MAALITLRYMEQGIFRASLIGRCKWTLSESLHSHSRKMRLKSGLAARRIVTELSADTQTRPKYAIQMRLYERCSVAPRDRSRLGGPGSIRLLRGASTGDEASLRQSTPR